MTGLQWIVKDSPMKASSLIVLLRSYMIPSALEGTTLLLTKFMSLKIELVLLMIIQLV